MTILNNTKQTILVVDDEKALRLLLGEFFKKQYDVVPLEGGHACLDWLSKGEHPAAIILDLMMPDINGMDVIKKIRKQRAWNDIAIIVLSSKESSSDRIAALRAGADDFLIKPFNPEELMVRIQLRMSRIADAKLQLA